MRGRSHRSTSSALRPRLRLRRRRRRCRPYWRRSRWSSTLAALPLSSSSNSSSINRRRNARSCRRLFSSPNLPTSHPTSRRTSSTNTSSSSSSSSDSTGSSLPRCRKRRTAFALLPRRRPTATPSLLSFPETSSHRPFSRTSLCSSSRRSVTTLSSRSRPSSTLPRAGSATTSLRHRTRTSTSSPTCRRTPNGSRRSITTGEAQMQEGPREREEREEVEAEASRGDRRMNLCDLENLSSLCFGFKLGGPSVAFRKSARLSKGQSTYISTDQFSYSFPAFSSPIIRSP